jgi:hypothetical protein
MMSPSSSHASPREHADSRPIHPCMLTLHKGESAIRVAVIGQVAKRDASCLLDRRRPCVRLPGAGDRRAGASHLDCSHRPCRQTKRRCGYTNVTWLRRRQIVPGALPARSDATGASPTPAARVATHAAPFNSNLQPTALGLVQRHHTTPTSRESTYNRVAIPPVLPCCVHVKKEHLSSGWPRG